MEYVPCPISNSMNFAPWLNVFDRFDHLQANHWELVQSCESGLLMLNPRPDSIEIAQHYPDSEYEPYFVINKNVTLVRKVMLTARSLLLHYKTHLIFTETIKPSNQHTLLEIGCSTGELLHFCQRHKGIPVKNIAGVEPHAPSAEYARKKFGLKVTGIVQDDEVKKFDRIVLWHTLEHIHALHETLHTLKELLAPEGLMVVALPNYDSFSAKRYQKNWIAYDAPRHLYHFLPETLAKLLEQHDLTITKQLPYFPDALYNNLYSEQLACKRSGVRFHILRIASAIIRGSMDAISSIIDPNHADTLVYFIKKSSR